jgi:hypothetical protein
MALDHGPASRAARSRAPDARLPRTNIVLLVAVAVAFLLVGVGLALVLMKFVLH